MFEPQNKRVVEEKASEEGKSWKPSRVLMGRLTPRRA